MAPVLLAFLVIAAPSGGAQAGLGDGVTIGDVAKMEPRKAIKYIYREASRRALELSQKHGDAVSQCLRREVVRIETKADGNHVFPRGLKAAIRYIHLENNTGGDSDPAANRINEMIDLVASQLCGVASDSSQ